MCELFAMSSSIPTEVSFSLDEFSKHGGLTDQHKDGWGIAYYDDNDARIIKEACPASESIYLNFVKNHSIRSHIIISHIRLATQGEISIRNTQPFSRELGGRQHVFAHNGDLPGLDKIPDFNLKRFKPIGNTDSEMAFCYLMEKMAKIWNQETPPDLVQRHKVIDQFAAQIRKYGIGNFIYSDSDFVFIHSHKRKSPIDNKTVLPGLHVLFRSCQTGKKNMGISKLKMSGLMLQHSPQPEEALSKKVVLAASVPLSNENWEALKNGEIKVFQNGQMIEPLLI